MNRYLEQMKSALVEFNSAAKTTGEQMARNKELYNADMAAEENERLLARLNDKKKEAAQKINGAADAGVDTVKAWARIEGAELTADAELLKYGVTEPQFIELVERYRNNGTMTSVLRQYGETAGYNTRNIMRADDRIAAYNSFRNNALSILGALMGTGFAQGANSPMLALSIEQFGEPNGATANALELL